MTSKGIKGAFNSLVAQNKLRKSIEKQVKVDKKSTHIRSKTMPHTRLPSLSTQNSVHHHKTTKSIPVDRSPERPPRKRYHTSTDVCQSDILQSLIAKKVLLRNFNPQPKMNPQEMKLPLEGIKPLKGPSSCFPKRVLWQKYDHILR